MEIKQVKKALGSISEYPYKIGESGKQAGVFLLLLPENGRLMVVLEKRTKDNSPHSAQVSFIGGGVEPHDKSLLDTALRETEEEIGVPADKIEVLGYLEPTTTLKSNYRVYPFVGLLKTDKLHPSKSEVEKLLFVPLKRLIEIHPFDEERYSCCGKTYKTFIIPHKDEIIWGATARILNQFIERIKGAKHELQNTQG